MINLNNGITSPAPRVVARGRQALPGPENQAPVLLPGHDRREHRDRAPPPGGKFGCDPEEMAITRNASESLQIAQNGIDLAPGDEVITTEQDYPRMLTTWDQRVRRDKIKVTRLQFPVPTTPGLSISGSSARSRRGRRCFHFCHITNLTGQLFPVQRISPHGALEGDRHDRRRRPRRWATSRSSCAISSATATASACTSGCWLRSAPASCMCAGKIDPKIWPLQARARATGRHPQVRGDRHGAGGAAAAIARSAGIPPGHRRRAQGGAPALPDAALGQRGSSSIRASRS